MSVRVCVYVCGVCVRVPNNPPLVIILLELTGANCK